MVTTKGNNCVVRYLDNMIVLDGDRAAIHAEADSIVRRFSASAKQYQVIEDTDEHIVLMVRK